MTRILPEATLARLEELIARHLGLHFPKDRYRNLERGISLAAKELNFADVRAFAEVLLASTVSGDQFDVLTSSLTVGETYFFREKRIFEVLEEHILIKWIQGRRATTRHLNLWSTGCCTGEEAYSLAILIHKLVRDLRNWRIKILATDVNPRFLEKAEAGIYSEWSFRGTPEWVKERYFIKTGRGRYEILPYLKEMVSFSRLNLIENHCPFSADVRTEMDLILCRNVLMYFVPWQVNKVIDFFHRSLIDGGWLIVSPSEISCLQGSSFALTNFPGAILHQKRKTETETAEGFVPPKPGFVPEIAAYSCLLPEPLREGEIAPETSAWSQEQRAKFPASESPSGPELMKLFEEGHYAEVAHKLSEWLSPGQIKSKGACFGFDPLILLVKAYANLGKLDNALVWCDRGIAEDKLNPLLRYLRAIILQEQGQWEEALASLKQAVYLDPNLILGHFTLGNIAQKLGRLKESKKHFANAVKLLNGSSPDELVPESDGMTAGSLLKMIPAGIMKEKRG
jgi:chemotaxis protein methyltransferase CheR